MTGTITLIERATVAYDSYNTKWEPGTQTITMTGQAANGGIVDATSDGANVPKTNLTTEGILFLRNLDSAKTVTMKTTGGDTIGTMKFGETARWRGPVGKEVVLDTTGGAVNVQYLWLED